jgi:hypothetical protein
VRIIKFNQFINENVHDTPEEYVKVALMKIKTKLEKMFNTDSNDDVKKIGQSNTLDGVELQSCELSRYSKTQDSVKIKYSDAESLYDLLISISLKEAVPEDDTKDFSDEDIKTCYVKFKKYDLENFDIIGEISKNIDIKDINDNFLVDLKIEMDDKFGSGDEELEIETE